MIANISICSIPRKRFVPSSGFAQAQNQRIFVPVCSSLYLA